MSNTYWAQDGKYQKIYDRLKELIPDNGKADSMHIELLRCASNLYHDFYNNGAGNLSVYLDQISFIKSWSKEIKAKMRNVRGASPFDKIIDACMADALNESNLISAMLENKVTAVYNGYEKIMDAIILVVEEREQDSKFIIINASMGGWLDGTKEKRQRSDVLKQAVKCSRHSGREKQCRKWFKDAKPGDCLVLDPTCGVLCVNKVQNLRDVK